MKNGLLLIFFLVSLSLTIASGFIGNSWLEYIAKPLIIPSLIFYFLLQTKADGNKLRSWIVLALIFSWIGDVLLMFESNASLYFLLGLSSFLLAHLCYIIFFHRIRVKEVIKARVWLLLVIAVYYFALISVLAPYLGDMKLPVRIYGIVISFMLLIASHMPFIRFKSAGFWMMTGAILFVLSDSVLAINKFYHPFQLAGMLVMLTYGFAQFFIVKGAISYLSSVHKE